MRWRARAGVSPPTITRFCRALGCAGLREFKLRLAQNLAVGKSTLHRAVAAGDNMQTVTHKVLQGAVSALANLEQHVVPDDLERAATRIATARRVDCYGVGNVSMFMASDAQARFARLGINSGAYFDAPSAAHLRGDDEQQRRRAGDLVCRPPCAACCTRSRWRRSSAR